MKRARAICSFWGTKDYLEKYEQFKHIYIVWSNTVAAMKAQENSWKKIGECMGEFILGHSYNIQHV